MRSFTKMIKELFCDHYFDNNYSETVRRCYKCGKKENKNPKIKAK